MASSSLKTKQEYMYSRLKAKVEKRNTNVTLLDSAR